MRTSRTLTWDSAFALFPGTLEELARELRLTRQSLWNFRTGAHARPPHGLLRRFAAVLQRKGTADGSPAPTRAQLFVAWRDAFPGRCA